jgi:glutamate-1-semialdehyde 2,1-aminomutase
LPTTTVIEFNDAEALERELKRGDIACVLAEPVMTNVGMVRDAPGYLDTLRRLCSETGTILVFDETHTISSGYGGHSNAYGPKPDMMVIGKSIGGGVPTAVYGFSEEIAGRMAKAERQQACRDIAASARRCRPMRWRLPRCTRWWAR